MDRSLQQTSLQSVIHDAWEQRDSLGPATKGPVRDAVITALEGLDHGTLRVVEKTAGVWQTHEWLKKAVLLSFRLDPVALVVGAPGGSAWWDKVPLKCSDWNNTQFHEAGFRAVPGCIIRRSAYVAPNVVLMPSFINVGARIEEGSMIDTWATVGSCAYIGRNVHISGGAGIGGVLEPLQAQPVIIEDECFIGARSEVAEGVVVETGAVLSMGVFIGASTKIIDRETGEVFMGRVPAGIRRCPRDTAGQTSGRWHAWTQLVLCGYRKTC